jgi:phage terminase large subunit
MREIVYSPSRVYYSITRELKRYNMLRGGTRSTKSFSMTQLAVRWLMTGKIGKITINKGSFFILRESFPALRRTVYKDFHTIMSHEGLLKFVDHSKTTHTFTRHGREVVFFSADDDSKIHGPQSSIVWINEATAIDYNTFNQLNYRCSYFMFMDYNPTSPESWVKELEDGNLCDSKDISLDVSTVYDNKHLSDMQMKAIEGIRDEELRNVYLKGQWTKLSGLVFPYITIIKEMPEQIEKKSIGIDFGWTDPFVMLKVGLIGKDAFIDEIIHESEFDYENIDATKFQGVTCAADSADPRSIRSLRRLGLNVRKIKKPKIVESVRKCRGYNIHITRRSEATIKDFKSYKRKKNPLGEYVEAPEDGFDHSPDAFRYAIEALTKTAIKI